MSENVDPELGVYALEALVAANYCVGWNEAIEAAAELMERQPLLGQKYTAAAIRKLKKP